MKNGCIERLVKDETHEMQPPKLIISSETKTEIIITMPLEKYIKLKQQNAYFKGKEETVEERIDLARDSGYYQGRDSLYEELLKEDNPEPAPIDILDSEAELRKYKKDVIEKMEKEINRLKALLEHEEEIRPIKRIEGNIEGLEKAIAIIKGGF